MLFEVWCLGAYGRYHPEAACINCLHTDISRRCIAAATTDASLAEAIALMQMQMQMQSSECSLVCAGHVLHSVSLFGWFTALPLQQCTTAALKISRSEQPCPVCFVCACSILVLALMFSTGLLLQILVSTARAMTSHCLCVQAYLAATCIAPIAAGSHVRCYCQGSLQCTSAAPPTCCSHPTDLCTPSYSYSKIHTPKP